MQNKHEIWELRQMQALPLESKITMTKHRIQTWVDEFGVDGVYVSFSGGKDSTVLLDIARQMFPDMKAMFVDVPTQYPELKEFALTFDNVDILKPKISFAQVCEKYGFPMISKEVAECVQGARRYLTSLQKQNAIPRQASINTFMSVSQEQEHLQAIRRGNGANISTRSHTSLEQIDSQAMVQMTRGGEITSIVNSEELENMTCRTALILGMLTKDNQKKANIPSCDRSQYSQEKYKFFLEAPFEISNKCCNVMKKEPAHTYYRKTGRKPILATMASESRLRTQKWLQNGCNGFNLTIPTSTPMSFWTEQDVLWYIKENNLPICSVYGEVVTDYGTMGQCDNQMSFADFGIFDNERPLLKTTGCQRTGCVLCGFGCHLEKESRFLRLKETHPKFHNLLHVLKNNGVTYAEAIDWINEHGNMSIKY